MALSTNRFIAPLAVAALALVCAARPAAAQDVKIASVNAAKVFNDMQETKDLKAKMEGDRKNLDAQNTLKQKDVKDAKDARDQLKPDAPQYQDSNKNLMQKVMEYNVWQQMTKAQLEHDQKMQMKSLFDKITATVSEIAAQKGYDIVLSEQHVELPENIDDVNVDQLRALINQRNMMFLNPKVDITNDVIAALDTKYKAAGAK